MRVQTFPPQMVAALPAVVPESGLSWIPVGKIVPQIVPDFSAVHFTIIPYEPNTIKRHVKSHIFCGIRPCTNNIVYARFEVFRTFLCAFMSILRIFVSGIMGKCTSRHLLRYFRSLAPVSSRFFPASRQRYASHFYFVPRSTL